MKLNIVTPRTGLAWVRMGLRTYFRQPLALTGLFFMYTTVVLLLAVVPGIGVLAGGMLVPAASLGLMAATAAIPMLLHPAAFAPSRMVIPHS